LTYGSKATEWGRGKALFSASSGKLNSLFNFPVLFEMQAFLRTKRESNSLLISFWLYQKARRQFWTMDLGLCDLDYKQSLD